MVAILGFTRDDILGAVKDMYTAVATAPTGRFHFPVGLTGCRAVGYPEEALRGLPDAAVESFAGVGYPFRAEVIRTGDTVLDIGSGSGTDALIASRLVGPSGKVYALDMTPAMVTKLRRLAPTRASNVEVIEGNAERIPRPDASVDVVTSNGMLNLVPDKRRAIAEMFRVLRPGGCVRVQVPFLLGYHGYPDDYFRYTHSALCRMFEEAGFRVAIVETDWTKGAYLNAAKILEDGSWAFVRPWWRFLTRVLSLMLFRLGASLDTYYAPGEVGMYQSVAVLAEKPADTP